jgi:hypothetical protein
MDRAREEVLVITPTKEGRRYAMGNTVFFWSTYILVLATGLGLMTIS